MAAQLDALIAHFEKLWPVEGAEDWDAPGLVVGSANQRVTRVLLSVDVTDEILDEAIDGGFDLILAHHPYLLKPINSVTEDKAKGALAKCRPDRTSMLRLRPHLLRPGHVAQRFPGGDTASSSQS